MFGRILIANRGEIACRIIRSAGRLGVATVAVYSDADRDALHVHLACEAYHIGAAEARRSYLNAEAILDAAALAAVDAIHPGYGFLAENAAFADACRDAGFVFIGPPAAAIRAMGTKATAKELMAAAGIPVIPGYHGADQDLATLAQAADAIGYPVLLKAVAGGGGKGMRSVETRRALAPAIESARREALAAFGNGDLLIEKHLARPRHVEVQVFADRAGAVVALFDRDCSIQRRHQKIIEEAPAPGLAASLRQEMAHAATRAARTIAYEGAGTVEFLLDAAQRFYFMEMNTRLQVEHPVTEMITGFDLVEWQLRIAAGEPLPCGATELSCNGHAFEARLYAEDPGRDFLPAPGRLRHLRFPAPSPHVRVDPGVREGDTVGSHYDPMIAKLVVWDVDRARALARLRTALAAVQVVGPACNREFLTTVAAHPAFAEGEIDTGFIERHADELFAAKQAAPSRLLALACLAVLLRRDEEARAAAGRSADPYSPWHRTDGWRLNDDNYHTLSFRDGDAVVEVTVHYRPEGLLLELPGERQPLPAAGEIEDGGDLIAEIGGLRTRATIVRAGDEIWVMAGGHVHRLVVIDPAAQASLQEAEGGSLQAPMPGRVIAVNVRGGDSVRRGATLLVLEAMKMEHAVTAPTDGVIARVHYAAGEQVEEGATLVSFVDDGADDPERREGSDSP